MADEILSNPSTSRPGSPTPSLPQTLPPQRGTQPAFRFTWDRKRGPGSVSNFSEVESKADYVGNLNAARGEIQGLNDASLPLDALGAGWSSAKHGFHAISTVLNHPTKRAAPPKAHSTLPTVPPADLPRVRRKDFDGYLKDIGPHWDAFQRTLAQPSRERSNSTTTIEGVDPDILPTTPISPSTSMVSGRTTRARPMPSLDTVPPVFFDPDFNMTNPATFALVTEMNLTNSGPQGVLEQDPASISYSVPLLEKLSHYADTVEGHLVQEIQARSSSFFSALTNLNELQSESERCLRRIADLKATLTQIDEKGAKKGLELVREDAKIIRLKRLEDGVKLVKDVNEMRTIARGLAGAGEWSDALNVVENVQALMDYKAPGSLSSESREAKRLSTVGEEDANSLSISPILPPVDTTKFPPALQNVSLRSLQAFASLPTELRTLSAQIASTLADEFSAVARQYLVLRTENALEIEANHEEEQIIKERLSPFVVGMMRTGDNGLKDGLERWREMVMSEIRSAVKQHLDHLTNAADEEDVDTLKDAAKSPPMNKPLPSKPLEAKTASLAQALAEMSHTDFLAVMRRIYPSLLSCLRGVKELSNIIFDIVKDQSTRNHVSSPRSPTANGKEVNNSTLSSAVQSTVDSVLFAATELAHSRVSKLIATRTEQHAQLKLFEFYTFYEESWSFIVNCEMICKKMVVALRGTLGGQSKAFLQAFHADRLTRSAKWVEQEEWKAIEISPRSQRVADMIVASAVGDLPEIVFPKHTRGNGQNAGSKATESVSPATSPDPNRESIDEALNPEAETAPSPQPNNAAGEVAKAKCLTVEDRPFYVVAASLQVLGLVIDYLKVMVNLNGLTMECMSRLVEFLKVFNSRTCQVVLGAGAMRSAGLKNITARHLAFASQSLSVIISLIPYIREAFRRHLDPKQFVLLTEFDKLKRDYQEHQNEIHQKFITIMGDVLNNYLKSLQEVRWDSPQEIPGPNDYIQGLVKQTVTLYKVLHKFLGPSTTEPIMSEAFAMINHRLGEEYQKIPLPSVEAKELMLTDARFLHEKLSGLRDVGSLNNMVVTIVQEKPIMSQTVTSPNGVANGVNPPGSSVLANASTPRPRGSIDLQAQPRSNTRQSTLGATTNNLAARPSPFAKRTLASLFGGGEAATSNSPNSSSISLASTQDGSSGLLTPQLQEGISGLAAVGSSGGVTPEMLDGRGSPITSSSLPSPPRTPGSTAAAAVNSGPKGSNAKGSTEETPQENVGPTEDQGTESSTKLRAAEEQ